MSIQNQALLALGSIKAFRGYAVNAGVVQVTDDQMIKHLNDTYAEVVICNYNALPGEALFKLEPGMFNSIKTEFQDDLQMSLQSQLAEGNDVDVDFYA